MWRAKPSITEREGFMKRQSAFMVVPFCLLLAGCTVESSEQYDDVASEMALQDVPSMPEAAATAMKAAESANLQPQFHACPFLLNYDVIQDAQMGDWDGYEGFHFVNKPTWSQESGGVRIKCGTTSTPDPGMFAMKFLPGFTSCTTSTVGSYNAWFVCT
jgi:hypothetical protein